MMRIITAAVIVFSLLPGCSKPPSVLVSSPLPGTASPVINSPVPGETTDTGIVRSYLALGDSYTYGQSVPDNQKLPVQVARQLTGLGFKVGTPEVIARSGWTTGDLLDRLKNESPNHLDYDFVTLLIGVNNQYQGRSQAEYREEFAALVDKAISYAANKSDHVFILSIPDWSVMPFAASSNRPLISKQIDSFNVINKAIAVLKNVRYTDIVDLSRMAAHDSTLVATDGLHPSGEQYREWANRLVPTIRVLFY